MRAYSVEGERVTGWKPTTWAKLGKREEHLEAIVAADPQVLGLDPYMTGLGSDFVAFRQAALLSPTGRRLLPDVVVLTSTGHVLLVEVKLEDNGELRNRSVIAQIVDYAAAVADLSEGELLNWLGASHDESWTNFVRRSFPSAHKPELLAAAFMDRVRRADIHLAIVCDIAPDGLLDTMRLISSQAALGEFQLHLIELTPLVNDSDPGRVLMVPSEVARTEIVTRTSVTVRLDDSQQVKLDVSVSSPDETQAAVKSVKKFARPEFQTVVDEYNNLAPEEIHTYKRNAAYRIIEVPGWPWHVHYEFLDMGADSDDVLIALHVESGDYPQVCRAAASLASALADQFPDIEYLEKKSGRCQLNVTHPISDSQEAAQAMLAFIGATRAAIEGALDLLTE